MGIDRMAVIGAGQMGSGIAQVAAQAGLEVVVADAVAGPRAGARSRSSARRSRSSSRRGSSRRPSARSVLGRIRPAASLDDCAGADLAIEAIVENEGVKKEIFRKLDALLAPGGDPRLEHLLDLHHRARRRDEAARTAFVGMHFMNPPPVMQLIEIIRGLQTSDATYAGDRSPSRSASGRPR